MGRLKKYRILIAGMAVFFMFSFCIQALSLFCFINAIHSSATDPAVSPSTSSKQPVSAVSCSTSVTISTSAGKVVKNIAAGWNLGNTLDAYASNPDKWMTSGKTKEDFYETLFGNPKTTKAMIDKIAQTGCSAVRIPVTYTNHMDSSGNIDSAWLARIAEVVGYVQKDGMYCIINVHHDTGQKGWLNADPAALDVNKAKFTTMWKQISKYFAGYGSKLLFEGYNEILDQKHNWSSPSAASLSAANQLNQSFVDAVRSTGKNNSTRVLIVNTYAAKADTYLLKGFKLPTDTVSGRLIVEVHMYDTSYVTQTQILNRLNQYFIQKKVPVLIGEYATSFRMSRAARIENVQKLISAARKYSIPVFWWDDGNYRPVANSQCNFALLDRVSLKWYDEAFIKAIIQAAKGSTV